MKVMHVGQMIGGLDIYIRNTVSYASTEIEFVLVHGDQDKSKPIVRPNGLEVKEYITTLRRPLRPYSDIRSLIDVCRYVRRERPDLIHCHSAKGGVIGRLAGFLTRTKTVYTPHAFSFLSTPSRIKRFFYKQLERIASLDSYLLACSNSERFLGRQIVWYQPSKCRVWHNAVPDAMLEVDNEKKPIGAPYIAYIGRPSYQKNTIFLIDVIKRVHEVHPEVKFMLLGLGFYSPDQEELMKRIKRYHLEEVLIMKQWASHKDTLQIVNNALFYLTTSRYEGLPLSVVEAMSLGKAIIASATPGNTDCVVDRQNGRVLELNESTFAKHICNFIENPALVEKYGKASRELFERDFQLSSQIIELEDIYREVVLED